MTVVRELSAIDELDAVARLFASVWGDATVPVSRDLLRALAHEGNYVAGAFDGDDRLLGGSMAFFAHPGPSLHSHITGVVPEAQGRQVGLALKHHQRAWALERGVPTITWTYDPLVRRNGWFNLAKLGAVGVEYLPDFYGSMADAVNAGDRSDRLLVRWDLAAGPDSAPDGEAVDDGPAGLAVGADGGPVRGPGRRCQVPADIEAMRRTDPALAAAWRLALHDVLGAAVAGGARVVGMSRDGWYRLDPA